MSPRVLKSLTSSVAVGMLLLAIGCGDKKPPAPPPAPPPATPAPVNRQPPAPPPAEPPRPAPPTPRAPTDAEMWSQMSLADANAKGYLADVFFDFDKADLSDTARAALQKDADFLKVSYHGDVKVLISGHADERGTSEYNLALGERRAAATRDYLVSLGVAAGRINIVSKGEEQPFCHESTEACWSQNRRGHFEMTAK